MSELELHRAENEAPGRPVRSAGTSRDEERRRIAAQTLGHGHPEAPAVAALQRLSGNAAVGKLLEGAQEQDGSEPSPVKEVIGSGGGEPLRPSVRSMMEAGLGHDFGDVRVHHDARASESDRARRDAYRARAAYATHKLAELLLEQGDATGAAAVARRGLFIDRYQDGLWRALIEAHRSAGDRAAESRARREYREFLDDLGIAAEGGAGMPSRV